jgi:membrane fusion protein, multidrug efflux system
VPGKLKSISVDLGDQVTPGQLLAEIEAPELLIDLEEAEAVVEREQSRIDQAEARLASIQLTEREGRASAVEAKAGLAIARAELKVAVARLHRAKARVSLTRIVSPIDGIVSRRRLHAGELTRGQTASSSAILTIAETSRLKAKLYVPERELPYLEKGNQAMLRPKTAFEEVFKGGVAGIDVILQPTEVLGADIEFDNSRHRLRPGQKVDVILELAKQPGVLTIPVTALFRRFGDKNLDSGDCYRVVNNIAFRTTVKLGDLGDGGRRIEVLSGLNEGDQVITKPTPDIKGGLPIGPAKK